MLITVELAAKFLFVDPARSVSDVNNACNLLVK